MSRRDRVKSLIRNKWITLRDHGAAHIFIGSFITKFVAFFASILIVRLFSKTEYGLLSYVETIFGYIYLLAGFGLTNAILRYVILSEGDQKFDTYHFIMRRSTVYNVLIVLVAAVFFCWVYPHEEDFLQAKILLPLLIISLPVHSLTDSGTMMLRAMFDNRRYAFVSCLIGICALGGKYVFATLSGLKGALLSNVIVYGLFAAYLLLLIHRLYFKGKAACALSPVKRKEIGVYSLQYMVTNGLWTVFMLNDIFLLGRLTENAAVVADYKVAYALPGSIALFSASIGIFVAPLFVRHENDLLWIRKNYRLVLAVSAVLIGGVSAVLFIAAEPVVALLYGKEYVTVVPIMRVLLAASLINNVFRYTNANLLAAMGRIKVNLYVSLLGVLFQIGIGFLLIPRYGAVGAAYTSVLVYTLMAVAVCGAFYRYYLKNNKSNPSSTDNI